MSNYSNFLKSVKENELKKFFGEINHTSNKYFTFNRIIDNDNFIIVTNNIISVKGNPVLIVGSNKVVYLKDWNIRPVHNYYNGVDADAVKLSRQYFKVYTFKNEIEGYEDMEEIDFDGLMAIAKEQEEANIPMAYGHMG